MSFPISISTDGYNGTTAGDDSPRLQSRWRYTDGAGGKGVVVTIRGAVAAVLADSHDVGETSLPAKISLKTSKKVILDDVSVEGESAAIATQTLRYRFRNDRETDADVANGLQRRDIGARWIERQEVIEHWAARQSKGNHGKFKAALFQAWLAEPDPATRLDYCVELGEDAPVSLDDSERGSDLTLAVAQRYAMGVQYAGNRMLQVEVNEIWRKPPNVNARCNVRLAAGIPPEHRPQFRVDNLDGSFDWVRGADAVQPAGGSWYKRQVVYLCIPKSMKPADPPEFWGDTAVDELLNPVE